MLNFESALAIAAGKSENTIESLRALFLFKYPTAIAALKLLDKEYTAPRSIKGYYLSKRPNKKLGFVYYVRYLDSGKMLTSKWCTHTNNSYEAERFAIENRQRLVKAYKKTKADNAFDILREYYEKDSVYMRIDSARNRIMVEHLRRTYLSILKNGFVPFLESENIKSYAEIDSALITRYQNHLLLNHELKPQTVNNYLCGINAVFSYLCSVGIIDNNPFNNVKPVKELTKDVKKRGCYHIDQLNGVFNRPWEDKTSYVLNLLIYATNLRNSEIERIKLKNIIKIGGYRFIEIMQSKTENGIRIVPLHDFVYRKICDFAAENHRSPEDYIFSTSGHRLKFHFYQNATYELGRRLKLTKEQVDEQNITFYSGRHFWKTLMNAGELGDDIEEIFMGHSVSKDVAKSYNHRDKQGNKKMLAKTRRMFKILDEKLFKKK